MKNKRDVKRWILEYQLLVSQANLLLFKAVEQIVGLGRCFICLHCKYTNELPGLKFRRQWIAIKFRLYLEPMYGFIAVAVETEVLI